MKEQEPGAAPGRLAVYAVQPGDAVGCQCQQLLVVGKRLAGGVPPVRQNREREIPLGVGEIVPLDLVDLLAHAPWVGEHRGNDDDRAEFRGNAVAQVELGEPAGTEELGHVAVHDRDREVGSGYQCKECQRHDRQRALVQLPHVGQQEPEQEAAQKRDRAQVSRGGEGYEGPAEPTPEGWSETDLLFERPAAGIDEPEAEMRIAIDGCLA